MASEGLAQGRPGRVGGGAGPDSGRDGDVLGLLGSAGVCVCVCVEKGKNGPCVRLLSLPTLFSSSPGSCSSWATSQRYFVLEDGVLRYATTRQDVSQRLVGVAGEA